jgi:bifunctional DNase/RNase
LSWEELFGGRRVGSEPPDPQPAPDEIAEAREFSSCVRAAVADLPRGQREAVLLVYLEGLSYRETAGVLQINPSAVKSRLHKGRLHLQKRLRDFWKEDLMSTSVEQHMVEMRITDVRRTTPREGERDRTVIELHEVDGTRKLPFWVGRWEGDMVALLVEKVRAPRPLTHAFTASLLRAGGVRVRQVQIHRLAEETFYAAVVLEGASGETRTVDARPSDSVALALELEVPIYVATEVLEAVEASENEPPELPIGAKDIVADLLENWKSPRKSSC